MGRYGCGIPTQERNCCATKGCLPMCIPLRFRRMDAECWLVALIIQRSCGTRRRGKRCRSLRPKVARCRHHSLSSHAGREELRPHLQSHPQNRCQRERPPRRGVAAGSSTRGFSTVKGGVKPDRWGGVKVDQYIAWKLLDM